MVKSRCAERGQTLVIFVFALVSLLVMVGLALDGGMVFLQRRRMQNAADAAALAGTRLLAEAICGEGADDAAIAAEANYYAESNGVRDTDGVAGNGVNGNVVADYVDADEAVLGRVGDGSIPIGATGISVTVEISQSTYFVSLVGIDTAGASAYALAMTGPLLMAGGLRPFGVPLQLVQDLDPGNSFTVNFGHGGTVQWAGGSDQFRGWLNLKYVWNPSEALDWPRATDECPGASCKQFLEDWMADGWDGILYGGDYIHALPGSTTSNICTAPENTLLYAPIYDDVPECSNIPDPKPDCPTAGSTCFHIVGFVGLKITQCIKSPDKEITAQLVETIIGEGVPSLGLGLGYGEGQACETYTQVVTLWR
ncbi:MAG: pilus assembly protein TadG-related protein [Anaerolineae bacterium]